MPHRKVSCSSLSRALQSTSTACKRRPLSHSSRYSTTTLESSHTFTHTHKYASPYIPNALVCIFWRGSFGACVFIWFDIHLSKQLVGFCFHMQRGWRICFCFVYRESCSELSGTLVVLYFIYFFVSSFKEKSVIIMFAQNHKDLHACSYNEYNRCSCLYSYELLTPICPEHTTHIMPLLLGKRTGKKKKKKKNKKRANFDKLW